MKDYFYCTLSVTGTLMDHFNLCFLIVILVFVQVTIGLDFATYCRSCSLHTTCECMESPATETLLINCDGTTTADESVEIPYVNLDPINCMGRTYNATGRKLAISISNYAGKKIPANIIRTNAINIAQIEVSFFQLKNLTRIDPDALLRIRASSTRLTLRECPITEIPFETLEKGNFGCSNTSGPELEFSDTDIDHLPEGAFERLAKRLIGCSFVNINLRNHKLEYIPSGAFSNLRIENGLDLASESLLTIKPGAFKNVSIGGELVINTRVVIEAGAFHHVRMDAIINIFRKGSMRPRVEVGAFEDVHLRHADPWLLENLKECQPDLADRGWYCARRVLLFF